MISAQPGPQTRALSDPRMKSVRSAGMRLEPRMTGKQTQSPLSKGDPGGIFGY